MRTPPGRPTAAVILGLARRHWLPTGDSASYLPVGFGAHHWLVDAHDGPSLLATWDLITDRRDAGSFERTYAAAAALRSQGLDFVHPSLRAVSGEYTVQAASGVLSVAEWLPGATEPASSGAEAGALARLHATLPVAGLTVWQPAIDAGMADRLADLTEEPWRTGPLGEAARAAIRSGLSEIAGWVADYLRLASKVDTSEYVVTHGEPGAHNQLTTAGGDWLLVDWESALLAPAERDLAGLLPLDEAWLAAYGRAFDPDLVRLFDLEWRLGEIEAFAIWLRQPHASGEDDRIALGGLRHELTRPHRRILQNRTAT